MSVHRTPRGGSVGTDVPSIDATAGVSDPYGTFLPQSRPSPRRAGNCGARPFKMLVRTEPADQPLLSVGRVAEGAEPVELIPATFRERIMQSRNPVITDQFGFARVGSMLQRQDGRPALQISQGSTVKTVRASRRRATRPGAGRDAPGSSRRCWPVPVPVRPWEPSPAHPGPFQWSAAAESGRRKAAGDIPRRCRCRPSR